MNSEAVAKPGKILRLLNGIEETILCLLLIAMMSVSCLQIALRSFFSTGLLWADPLIQQLVLWSGLLGAAMATARGKHIALDLVTYLVPKRLQPWILLLSHLLAALTTTALVYAAWVFLANEITYGSPGLFALPSWVWNLIFPLAFTMIALRYCIALCQDLGTVIHHHRKDRR